MRILFTGFDPFGGEKINPAGEAVKMMKNEIQGAEILKLEVPTVFGKAGEVLKKAVEQYRPDAVVCVGQAGGRAAITPEMIAVNIMDARIPDNAGNKPCHELIIKEGREAYFDCRMAVGGGETCAFVIIYPPLEGVRSPRSGIVKDTVQCRDRFAELDYQRLIGRVHSLSSFPFFAFSHLSRAARHSSNVGLTQENNSLSMGWR